jgi:plasmid stability protein
MASNLSSRELDKFVVRLPDGMREQLGVAARANKRTMNAEIVSRLEASLQQDENEAVPDFVTPMVYEKVSKIEKMLAEQSKQIRDLQERFDVLAPRGETAPSSRTPRKTRKRGSRSLRA